MITILLYVPLQRCLGWYFLSACAARSRGLTTSRPEPGFTTRLENKRLEAVLVKSWGLCLHCTAHHCGKIWRYKPLSTSDRRKLFEWKRLIKNSGMTFLQVSYVKLDRVAPLITNPPCDNPPICQNSPLQNHNFWNSQLISNMFWMLKVLLGTNIC